MFFSEVIMSSGRRQGNRPTEPVVKWRSDFELEVVV